MNLSATEVVIEHGGMGGWMDRGMDGRFLNSSARANPFSYQPLLRNCALTAVT